MVGHSGGMEQGVLDLHRRNHLAVFGRGEDVPDNIVAQVVGQVIHRCADVLWGQLFTNQSVLHRPGP